MLTLLGQPQEKAAEDAKKIMALETKLAEASRTRVELRDPIKNYNKMVVRQLQDLTPDWNWSDYFNAINLLEPGGVNVHQPEFFKTANNLFKSTSLDDWKAYLRWHLIMRLRHISRKISSTRISILISESARYPAEQATLETCGHFGGWRHWRCAWKTVRRLLFSSRGERARTRTRQNLKEALADRIKTLDWMDEPTKKEALKKLAAMNVKIGYPDKWLDYSLLKIDRGPFVTNTVRAEKFAAERDLQKIGKPVDRTDWGMTPPTVTRIISRP